MATAKPVAKKCVRKARQTKPLTPPAPTAPPASALRIEMWPLSHLKKWPKNPKKHDLPGIKASMRKFGFTKAIGLDEKTRRIVEGHGRLEALLELKDAGKKPPKRIVVKDGEWYVPVQRGLEFDSEDHAAEYVLVDNRLTEKGGWDDMLLLTSMQALPQPPIGWTQADMDALKTNFAPDETPAPAPPAPPDNIKGVAPNVRIPLVFYADNPAQADRVRKAFAHPRREYELNGRLLLAVLDWFEKEEPSRFKQLQEAAAI
jgi:hypothetical protein